MYLSEVSNEASDDKVAGCFEKLLAMVSEEMRDYLREELPKFQGIAMFGGDIQQDKESPRQELTA